MDIRTPDLPLAARVFMADLKFEQGIQQGRLEPGEHARVDDGRADTGGFYAGVTGHSAIQSTTYTSMCQPEPA